MKLPWLLSTLVILCSMTTTMGYHILCIHHIPYMSHHHLGTGIVKALLKAGHKVTWVTPYPDKTPKNKNLTLIDVSSILEITGHYRALDEKMTNLKESFEIKELARNITHATLQKEALRQALVTNQYDAVVSEWFLSEVEAGYAAVQQVPWILLSTIVMHPRMEHLVDTVRTIPTNPMSMLNFPMPMTLKQRLINTAVYLFIALDFWKDKSSNAAYYESAFSPIAKARGVTLPPYTQALHNISVLLVNSHPSFSAPQSLPPNVVEIGGFHIDEEIPSFPKDLQKILDDSPQGVIFFSMGSVVKSSTLPEQTKKELIKMLGDLPYSVLWKYEEEIENLPKNIHVRKWLPQASIFAHPNTKVFITHGGLLSTLEALHYGVPMLTIPVFRDQPFNADTSVRSGIAVKVEFGPDMVPKIQEGLKELLTNDSYYNKIQHMSKLFRHRPVTPSKLIAHYVELAIESKGAFHIRSKALLYAWYELLMLDQLIIISIILYLLYRIIKIIIKFIKYLIGKLLKSKKQKNN